MRGGMTGVCHYEWFRMCWGPNPECVYTRQLQYKMSNILSSDNHWISEDFNYAAEGTFTSILSMSQLLACFFFFSHIKSR